MYSYELPFPISGGDLALVASAGTHQFDNVVVRTLDLTDGLMAHYQFNGNTDDASGNDFHGTEHNGVSYVDGVVGPGAQFDGSDDYVDVPDDPLLLPQVTAAGFVSYGVDYVPPNDHGYKTVSIVDAWGGTGTPENFKIAVEEIDGLIRFAGYFHDWDDLGPTGYQVYPETVVYSEPIEKDRFYHVAMTYDGDTLRLYVGGVKVDEVVADKTPGEVFPWDVPDFRFGISRRDTGHFAGILDETRIYNRALSETEIQQLANWSPAANAGPDVVVLAQDHDTIIIQGNGSDPDGDSLEYRWLQGATELSTWQPVGGTGEAYLDLDTVPEFSAGEHTLTLEVTDGMVTSSDEMLLVITIILPQQDWNLSYVDSEELGGKSWVAANAFDDNPATFWHTEWIYADPDFPHEIQIDLGNYYTLSGFGYLPRQDGNINGTIDQYAFYVSLNEPTVPPTLTSIVQDWGDPVAEGVFPSGMGEKEVLFSERVAARYIRLVALREINGKPWATMAGLTMLGTVLSCAGDYYVSPSGDDDNNTGIATDSPFATIQHAIDVAEGSEFCPVTIHVACGTYVATGFPDERIRMDAYESLEGGWNNDFSQRWDFQNDGIEPPSEYQTIIAVASSATGVFVSNIAEPIEINGFTFKGEAGSLQQGVRVSYSKLLAKNCQFLEIDGYDRYGGGIHITSSIVEVFNSTFTSCEGKAGGAIYSSGSGYPWSTFPSDLTVNGCYFSSNVGSIAGGAICVNNTIYTISNSTFTSNTTTGYDSDSGTGGAICVYAFSSNSMIVGCTFSGNISATGGAIWGAENVKECQFVGNKANSTAVWLGESGFGGAIFGGNLIEDSVFSNNLASKGGAISTGGVVKNCQFFNNGALPTGYAISYPDQYTYFGGAIHSSSQSIVNCSFVQNYAGGTLPDSSCYVGHGAAIYNTSSGSIISNSFFGNYTLCQGDGGAIYNTETSSPTITNSILWGNMAENGPEIFNVEGASPIVTYSNVQGGYPGDGNLDVEPLFVNVTDPDPQNWDLHLRFDSPCIDVGISEGAPDSDIDGDARPYGSGIDMGADECLLTVIIDNSDPEPGFTSSGDWTSSTALPGYYGDDYLGVQVPNQGLATWTHSIHTPGNYRISAWWTSGGGRATEAPYTIKHNGSELETVRKNQTVSGGRFNLLGTYELEVGTLEVVLTNNPSGFVVADAIEIYYKNEASVIPQEELNVIYVDSEASNYPVSKAFDGNPNTMWHTLWGGAATPHPHAFHLDLGSLQNVTGFRLLPRQDGYDNGWVEEYAIYVRETLPGELQDWGDPVAQRVLAKNALEKEELFSPTCGRFVRFETISEVHDKPIASIAEFNVISTGTCEDSCVDPTILDNPQDVCTYEGQDATFSVSATGDEPLSYTWKLNGEDFGNDSPSLTIDDVLLSDDGFQVTCEVSNTCGSVTSEMAMLGVIRQMCQPLPASSVPKTGQTTPYGTGDDGEVQAGAAWPVPRFTDKGDGTIRDNMTGLIWLKDAKCMTTEYPEFDDDGEYPGSGMVTWQHALDFVAGMNDGTYPNCGLGYTDWRMPNIKELMSLVHFGYKRPALPDTAGTGQATEGDPFTGNLETTPEFWTATSVSPGNDAYEVQLGHGLVRIDVKTDCYLVWPVRGPE